jgi:Ca2+-binding RTX toxin-like protein
MLVAASPALADTRYASPGGDASNTACPQADPCDIQTAVEHGSVADGDVVFVLGGDHLLPSETVGVGHEITIQGDTTGPRPRLVGSGATALFLSVSPDTVVVRDLYIESTDAPSDVVNVDGAKVLERVEIVAKGTTSTGLFARIHPAGGVTVRDSVVRNLDSIGGAAIATAGVAPGEIVLRNVTAVSSGASAEAILASASYGSPQHLSLRNVIAIAPDKGLELEDDGGDDDVQVDVSYSNLSSTFDDASPDTVLNLGPGNQIGMPPLFVDAAAGDFHQLAGSPTRNAGSPDPLTGALDFDRQARVMGGTIDIGADEFSEPHPTSLPPQKCGGRTATKVGTGGPDPIRGTPKRDVIAALGGNDVIRGLGGNDVICGGKGRDRLIGGRGRDRLIGGPGNDRLIGGPGRDVLLGGPGRDVLRGGPGRDLLRGGPGRDRQTQ